MFTMIEELTYTGGDDFISILSQFNTNELYSYILISIEYKHTYY